MPPTFLIVGTDRLSRLILQGFFEFLNPDWQVFHAASSEEALSIAATTKLDLVSMDDSVLLSNGTHPAHALKAMQPDARIAILIGEAGTAYARTNFELEVCVIDKPLTLNSARELSKHFLDVTR